MKGSRPGRHRGSLYLPLPLTGVCSEVPFCPCSRCPVTAFLPSIASDVQAKATASVIGPCAFLPDTRQPRAPPLLAGSPSHPGHLASITCHSFGGALFLSTLSSGLGTLEAFLEDCLSPAQLALSFVTNIRGGWLSKLLARFRGTPKMGSWERQ